MATLHDPLADLKAEIAAEDAAAKAEPDDLPETRAEEARLAEAEEEQAKVAEAQANAVVPPEEPKKKGRKTEERMVPVERLNEYAVKVRQLEKVNEELERKLNPPPPEPTPPQRTEDQIRQEARAQARLEVQLERFQEAGNKDYTQKGFDAACDKIAKLIGGPTNLVALAIEATGSPEEAAKAIYRLGINDAPEINAFLQLSPIRQATHLSKLATARARRAQDDDEPKPPRRQRVEVEEEELEPLRPLQGATRTEESLGDDVPMDVWVERFDKQVLNKGKMAH